MSISSWAYDKDQYWLTDIIDGIKGSGHCEKEWDKKLTEEANKRLKEHSGDRWDKSTKG